MFNFIYKLSRCIYGMDKVLRFLYACDVPKRCTIGKNVVFEHNALGVTIYPDSIIEDNVHIQHHVTIGLRTHNSGSPIIRKGAFIGAHTLILGNVEIGEGAIIGAGSLVLDNVPANTIYYNVREKTIRKK